MILVDANLLIYAVNADPHITSALGGGYRKRCPARR